jgi:hypothetical protein
MRPNYPIFQNKPASVSLHESSTTQAFFVTAALSFLVIGLSFTPWIILLLPASALIAALVKRNIDIFGLGVCVLITISFSLFYYVFIIPDIVTIVRVAIIGLFAVGFLKSGREPNEYKIPLALIALFLVIAAVNSYYNSGYMLISELKLLFAGMFFFGLLLSAKATDSFPAILFGVIAAIAMLSVAVMFIYPVIGYAFVADKNAMADGLSGKFSGIMNHPQMLACILAVNLPLILHTYLTRNGPITAFALAVLGAVSVMIAISSSRTGLLAALMALFSTLYMLGPNLSPAGRRRRNLVWTIILIAIAAGLVTSLEQIQLFIFKTNDLGAGISLSGRDEIIGASWNGFMAKPLFGNGFQVPSDFTEHGAAIFGISSEATSVEKCFFITMLLEETGIVGTLIFLGAITLLLRRWHQKGAHAAVSGMLAFLTINLGEACILSPSSIGGLCWLSIFAVHNLTIRPKDLGNVNDPHRRRLY